SIQGVTSKTRREQQGYTLRGGGTPVQNVCPMNSCNLEGIIHSAEGKALYIYI
ncbi:Voltage-dependent T-type calcium channel subunit alpha-1H, partial [Araneus ventricosus]